MIYIDKPYHELARLAPKMIAVLPTAAVEQHGQHLPVAVDAALVGEVARRVELKLPNLVAMLPVLWCGSSHHHTNLPGVMSLRSETYINVLVDLVDCLVRTGFKRIFILNGHGGNETPFTEALFRLNLKYRGPQEPWIAAASYWNLAAKEIEYTDFMETAKLSHACEFETSMMMALRMDWVNPKLFHGETEGPVKSEYYDPLNYKPSRVVVRQSFDQLSPTGALGSPEKASEAKGRRLFETITPVVVDFLKEFATWKRRKFAKTKKQFAKEQGIEFWHRSVGNERIE